MVRKLLIALESAVLYPVLGEKPIDLGEIVAQTGAELGVLLHDQRIEERDDLLRAIHIRLEVPEIGAAVAILFAGDLLRRHLFDQVGRSPDQIFWSDGEAVDAFLQVE